EDGIRDFHVTGVQTCALPISASISSTPARPGRPAGSRGPSPPPAPRPVRAPREPDRERTSHSPLVRGPGRGLRPHPDDLSSPAADRKSVVSETRHKTLITCNI